MKPYDPHTAAQVWDRVQATAPPADAREILTLMGDELQEATTFQRMSRQLPPTLASAVRQLAGRMQTQATCLKGMYTMITGETPRLPPVQTAPDPPDIVLRRGYGRALRFLNQYQSRQTDPQYGCVFKALAEEKKAHCRRILELLGMSAK